MAARGLCVAEIVDYKTDSVLFLNIFWTTITDGAEHNSQFEVFSWEAVLLQTTIL